MANHLYQGDLPDGLDLGPVVAIDSETMGLQPARDRLCLVQLSGGDGDAHLVQIAPGQESAPNLARMLGDPDVLKLFHFGRFDIAVLMHRFGVLARPVYCTKIASRLVRTYTDRHGLKDLLREMLEVDISKQQQSSDWGAADADPGADRVCGVGRAVPAPAARRAGRAAGARGARRRWRRPASTSCRRGRRSTSPAGPRRTSSPMPEDGPRHASIAAAVVATGRRVIAIEAEGLRRLGATLGRRASPRRSR